MIDTNSEFFINFRSPALSFDEVRLKAQKFEAKVNCAQKKAKASINRSLLYGAAFALFVAICFLYEKNYNNFPSTELATVVGVGLILIGISVIGSTVPVDYSEYLSIGAYKLHLDLGDDAASVDEMCKPVNYTNLGCLSDKIREPYGEAFKRTLHDVMISRELTVFEFHLLNVQLDQARCEWITAEFDSEMKKKAENLKLELCREKD